MKALTTFTAVAALIAGMSVAAAQMSSNPPAPGNSTTGAPQQKLSGTGKYCLEQSPGGSLNCRYASLASCQQAAKSGDQRCMENPNSGTTGAK